MLGNKQIIAIITCHMHKTLKSNRTATNLQIGDAVKSNHKLFD